MTALRLLILGGSGMLGHKIFEVLNQRFETYATFREADGLWTNLPLYAGSDRTIGGVDALDFPAVAQALDQVKPQVVVNCIGIIKQLQAAHDPILSITVNALFPHRLAASCRALGTRMIHLSTDCVFSGRKGNYTETDAPDPEDLYGRTKLLGEVEGAGCLTLRTSIIGRDFFKQEGLLEWFLSEAKRGRRVWGFRRAIYSGFSTQALAGIVGNLIANYPNLSGVYHLASPPITKYDLLVKIRDAVDMAVEIEPSDEPRIDRSLNPARFVAETRYVLPGWDEMIAQLASDPTPYDSWREQYVAPRR